MIICNGYGVRFRRIKATRSGGAGGAAVHPPQRLATKLPTAIIDMVFLKKEEKKRLEPGGGLRSKRLNRHFALRLYDSVNDQSHDPAMCRTVRVAQYSFPNVARLVACWHCRHVWEYNSEFCLGICISVTQPTS